MGMVPKAQVAVMMYKSPFVLWFTLPPILSAKLHHYWKKRLHYSYQSSAKYADEDITSVPFKNQEEFGEEP